MAAKKKTSKKPVKKSMSKAKDMKTCETGCMCKHRIGTAKLSAMAFVLFIVTVWPKLGNALVRVHWGWYLAMTILFCAIACKKCDCKSCC